MTWELFTVLSLFISFCSLLTSLLSLSVCRRMSSLSAEELRCYRARFESVDK